MLVEAFWMAGCRSLICGSKIGRNNAALPENMLENWGGGGSQGVWDGEERLGEWKEGKELGHHCGRRAGVGRERGHQKRGSGILDPTPSGLAGQIPTIGRSGR